MPEVAVLSSEEVSDVWKTMDDISHNQFCFNGRKMQICSHESKCCGRSTYVLCHSLTKA